MILRRTLMAAALLPVACWHRPVPWPSLPTHHVRFTSGVNEDHPVGVGVKKMQEVLAAKTGGKMKIIAFWGGAAGATCPRRRRCVRERKRWCVRPARRWWALSKSWARLTCPSCLPAKKPTPCSTARR